MSKSTNVLTEMLAGLAPRARRLDLTDTQWAAKAGVRKETLSRLRRRQTCDLETLRALAEAVGARLAVTAGRAPGSTPDGHFPASLERDYEERLAQLCASADLDPQRWSDAGPAFFMAGMAVMLASVAGWDRRALLALAEHLHPGASEVAVFNRWLQRSPVRPARFLPMLEALRRHAA